MLLGAVVLVIAVLALRNPKAHVAAASSQSGSSGSSASSVTASGSKSASKSGTTSSTSPQHSRSTTASTSPTSSAGGGVKSVPLIVLNNSETSGLAKRAATQFETGGWTVSDTSNLTNNIVSSCAYYDPNATGAKAAADALQQQFPQIQRVKKRFAQLPSGPIVVVLTSGYSTN